MTLTLLGFLLLIGRESRGDGIAQLTTAKSIPQATIAVIDPESGSSTGGGNTDVKVAAGDIILFRIHFVSVPDNDLRGIQGYLTEYVPANTEVVGVRLIDEQGRTIRPRLPGLAPDDCGGSCDDFSSLPCDNASSGCVGGVRSVEPGSLSQVYGDTGLFYTTDTRLQRTPLNQFLTTENGIEMAPDPPLSVDRMAAIMSIDSPYYAHADWDWTEVEAFGTKNAVCGGKGTASTPYLYGSPVAGPETFYLYEATEVSPGVIEFNNTVGPWERIYYPGSQIAFGNPVTTSGDPPTRTSQPTSAGWDLTPNNPLPAGTVAVRAAIGDLRPGVPSTLEIALRVLDTPLDPVQNADVNCSEVFAGEVAGDAAKDNPWPFYLASPGCAYLNLKFDIDVDKILADGGEVLNYTLTGKNLSLNPQTNVVVKQKFDSTKASFVSATNGGVHVVDCDGDGLNCVIWPTMDLQPSDEYTFYSTFTAGGTGGRAASMLANYQSDQLPDPGFTNKAITVTRVAPIIQVDMFNPQLGTAPGSVASLSGVFTNAGSGGSTWDDVTLHLPTGWTIVPGSVTLGGVSLSCSDTGTNTPTCTMGEAFDVDEFHDFSFDVNVPAGEPTDLYTIDIQIWASVVAFGAFESYFAEALTVPVGADRSDPPLIDCPIETGDATITGTTSEPDGTDVRVYFNGLERDSDTDATGGSWLVSSFGTTFGELYNGLEVRATAQAPGELESEMSEECLVSSVFTCLDGVDNDGDGFTDYPADLGCSSPQDNTEEDPPPPECDDGVDNDGNGVTDFPNDLSCSSPDDTTEDGAIACDDGVDNDDDGLTDYPDDLGCTSSNDPDELDLAACQDGLDNDGDGYIDFPDDPGCHSSFDEGEEDYTFPDDLLKARLLIVFDTSGSMNWNPCNQTFTGGDGSDECPGLDVTCAECDMSTCDDGLANDSRIYKVKGGLVDAVTAYGSVEWALMRFHQRAVEFNCPTTNASMSSGGWQGAGADPCTSFDYGDLLVAFGPENVLDMVAWMDLVSNPPWTPSPGLDWQPRGTGTTPLAGSLASPRTYLNEVKTSYPKVACREYRVILVTDGEDTCGGDPPTVAGQLLGDDIIVHVVGFATDDPTIIANLNDIAFEGGSGSAVFADDEVALSAAIASIVSDSVVVETCNDWDDDCDGSTDEDFPLKGQACDDGQLGICKGTGTYVCSADELDVECQITDPGSTATTEECNGLDDDCNGIIDDVPGGCEPPPPELCNGIDDDGDPGTPDGADDPAVGQTCGSDLGECDPGITICESGSIVCDQPNGPQPETCDALDNDCDGNTDESLARPCYENRSGYTPGCVYDSGSDTWSCEGQCQTGVQLCEMGAWGICQGYIWENDELCNNLDDDCDGSTDETLTRPCEDSNSFGTCTGQETCSSGSWEGCTADTPAEETCNGLDDDCDGVTDQITRKCYDTNFIDDGCSYDSGNDVWSCVGECGTGTMLCASGSWGECLGDQTSIAELCNGLDDDCDGLTDKDENGNDLSDGCYSGPSATAGVGICTAGTRTCSTGGWSACVGEVLPKAESCDGLDNDCDSSTDEGLGQTTCGLGICEHTIDNCSGGIVQTCDPYEGAQVESCNGLDDDCNGITDGISEACYTLSSGCTWDATNQTWACEGTCIPGVRTCPTPTQGGTGTWLGCEYQQGPIDETCDGLDNDCDSLTDEDENGDPLSQDCYPPGSGLDTGCTYDATSMSWTCEGICQVGQRVCSSAQWDACAGQVTPQVESCNALDDDCDGFTDEPEDIPGLGQSCGLALGRCTPGTLQCINGQEVCDGGEGPFEGQCNGLDDDCDGAIDEADEVENEEGLPCGETEGECEPGETQCVGGEIVCQGGTQASQEVCDGLDNDCDGAIDNDAVCPPNSYCYQGACRPVCDPSDEFACPPNTDCENVTIGEEDVDICVPSGGDCGGETCPEGWICVNDECVDPCEGVECESWEECRQGNCVDQSCTAIGNECPAGQFCVDHECVDDPCTEAACDTATEYCVPNCDDTGCTASCEPLCRCEPGKRCDARGNCVQDLCHGVECTGTNVCDPDTGECVNDACFNVTCDGGETCYDGECVENTCSSVQCPAGYECVLIEDSDGNLAPQCRVDQSYWNPGSDGMDILATGEGGCGCRTSNPTPSTPPLPSLFLLGILGFGVTRPRGSVRRRSGGKGGQR